VRVFVVSEPVLETDWTRPGDSITSLAGDAVNLPAPAVTESAKFRMKDVVRDAALVFPAGAKWGSKAKRLIAPVYKEAAAILQ
jgi:hypothetical protein